MFTALSNVQNPLFQIASSNLRIVRATSVSYPIFDAFLMFSIQVFKFANVPSRITASGFVFEKNFCVAHFPEPAHPASMMNFFH